MGVDGDFYLNTATSDVYQRTAGAYGVIENIKGNIGPAGSDATVPLATAVLYGKLRLKTAPVTAADPIAAGDNDPRLSDARTPLPHTHQLPYDLAYSVPGDYTKSTSLAVVVGMFLSPRELYIDGTYANAIARHQGTVDPLATTQTCAFIFRLNTVEFARVTFSNNNYIGVFSSSNGNNPLFIEPGDIIDVVSPSVTNSYCKDAVITIVGCTAAPDCTFIDPA